MMLLPTVKTLTLAADIVTGIPTILNFFTKTPKENLKVRSKAVTDLNNMLDDLMLWEAVTGRSIVITMQDNQISIMANSPYLNQAVAVTTIADLPTNEDMLIKQLEQLRKQYG